MPTRTQGGYSFHMAVDPSSPGDGINDIIYIGCVGQGRSITLAITLQKYIRERMLTLIRGHLLDDLVHLPL